MLAPFRIACSIPTDQLLTTADAWNSYHSVAVHQDDVHYFIFITDGAGTDINQYHKAGLPTATHTHTDMVTL